MSGLQNHNVRVLMTGAGAPGGPGIIRCMLSAGYTNLLVADAREMPSGRALHPHFVRIPSAAEPAFIPELLRICKEHQIGVLLPLVTRELELLASNRTLFEAAGTQVLVSDAASLSIANNKQRMMQMLADHHLPVARFYRVDTAAEIAEKAALLGYPDVPVVIKPAVSNGSRGIRILDSNRDRFRDFFESKPDHIYSTLEEVLQLFGQRPIPEMLVMEYLPGAEFSVDCIVDRGNLLLILPRRRLAMHGGISTAGRFEQHEDIIRQTRDILRVLPLHGPVGLQFRENSEGKCRLLEINPRLQGTTTAATGMNINIPGLVIRMAAGENIAAAIPSPLWGLTFARYYDDIFFKPDS